MIEKNLTKIGLFTNLVAGKIPHQNVTVPSTLGRRLTQLKNEGQYLE